MDICEASRFGDERVDRHPWEAARIRVVRNLLAPLCAGRSDIQILDIGCGDLYASRELSGSIPNAIFSCIDSAFTDEIRETLKECATGYPISLYSSLEELKKAGRVQKADLILLLDVIEHIEDDAAFMKSLKHSGLITGDTRILITAPAYQSLFSNHDVYLKHYRRYNLPILSGLLQRSGFDVVRKGYFFSSLLIPRILQKRFQSMRIFNTVNF